MRMDVEQMLTLAIREQDPFLENPVDLSGGDAAVLYGPAGQIDSLALVTIMADVERQLHVKFAVRVRLAADTDLSPHSSPFSTFGDTVSFICARVEASDLPLRAAS